ncbi:MAG: BrnT family toxin [Spirochaetaceae bacterium]|nr:BrnT family toxin [Spirochaetaceae bacterium]MCF7950321.1 BrnT family toxin [Spirochaetaceae bacterium]
MYNVNIYLYTVTMRFEWDAHKAAANKQKHGISFNLAAEVFNDPLHVSILDTRFNYFEERWITLGATHKLLLLVVAHLYFTYEGEEIIRIVSAREATANEQRQYEQT